MLLFGSAAHAATLVLYTAPGTLDTDYVVDAEAPEITFPDAVLGKLPMNPDPIVNPGLMTFSCDDSWATLSITTVDLNHTGAYWKYLFKLVTDPDGATETTCYANYGGVIVYTLLVLTE